MKKEKAGDRSLLQSGKTTHEIARIERMSIRDISPILREEESKRQRHKDLQAARRDIFQSLRLIF